MLHNRSRRNARRARTQHLSRGVEVVARDAIGRSTLLHRSHRTNRDHLATRISDFELRDILRCLAEGLIALRENLPSASEIVEVVHILRTDIELECREDSIRRHSDFFCLLPIDIGVDGWRARIEEGEVPGQFWVLVGLRNERISRLAESIRT